MRDKIIIRPAVREDAAEWVRLKQQIQDIHVKNDPSRFASMHDDEILQQYSQLIQAEKTSVWVAVQDGRIAGYMIIQEKASVQPCHLPYTSLLIDEICVDEACRRQGIGRSLIDHARDIAALQNMKEVTLTVWNFNKEAVAFYQSIGMRLDHFRMSLPVNE